MDLRTEAADGGCIQRYDPQLKQQIVGVWERSVRATHHFLSPEDVDHYKQIVSALDFGALEVYCIVESDVVAGFIGVADRKIEMLFLSPEHIGRGFGKRLLDFAVRQLRADLVDVNEQNIHAVAFYQKAGFAVYARDEKDSDGKDYPILKMRLQTR